MTNLNAGRYLGLLWHVYFITFFFTNFKKSTKPLLKYKINITYDSP